MMHVKAGLLAVFSMAAVGIIYVGANGSSAQAGASFDVGYGITASR